jgi:hypothetical protein
MNLLDHNHIREYRARCGKVNPATGLFETVPPSWSPPRLQILESEHANRLMQWVSNLLARDDLHIVAVSPAAVCALRESDSMNNPLLMAHYTITIIYQLRTAPAATELIDLSVVAAWCHPGRFGGRVPARWTCVIGDSCLRSRYDAAQRPPLGH